MAQPRRSNPLPSLTRIELLDLVAEAVTRSETPLSIAGLRRALPKPYQQDNAHLVALVDTLVHDGRLFTLGKGKAPKVTARNPKSVLDAIARDVLKGGPVGKTDLKKRIKASAIGFEGALDSWLPAACARGIVFEHTRPRSKTKLYGLEAPPPPDPRPFLGPALKLLRGLILKLEPLGVTKGQILEALAGELGAPSNGAPKQGTEGVPAALPSSSSAAASSADRSALLDALRRLSRERPPGSLLPVRELRARVELTKSRFDAAALALAESGTIILHHHDYAASLPDAEREELVRDKRGTHYVGVALGRHA